MTAALAMSLLVGCVVLPLERDNYFDGGGDTRFVVTGVPDTMNAVGERFDVTVTTDPAPPGPGVAIAVDIASGGTVLERAGVNGFRARPTIGLLPVRAVLRFSIVGVADGPELYLPVVLRQLPQAATLSCASTSPCSVMPLAAERTLRIALRDASSASVSLPAGSYRYGEVTSRNATAVEVVGRPTPNDITVRAMAVGSSWVVFRTESGVADSLLLTVNP